MGRALLEETLGDSVLRGRPEAFTPLCVVIDKIDKIGADAVKDLLVEPQGAVRLDTAGADFVVDWLSLRDFSDAAMHAPNDSPAAAEVTRLFELLEVLGV